MKHVGAITGRELRSLFVSPVAYATLALFAFLAGFFFFYSVLSFTGQIAEAQQGLPSRCRNSSSPVSAFKAYRTPDLVT